MRLLPPRRSVFWFFFLITLVIGFVAGFHYRRAIPPIAMGLIGSLASSGLFIALSIILPLVHRFLRRIPNRFLLLMVAVSATLIYIEMEYFRLPGEIPYFVLLGILVCGVLWELGWRTIENHAPAIRSIILFLPILIILFATTYLILKPGKDSVKEVKVDEFYEPINPTAAFDYSSLLEVGNHEVDEFSYGRGNDRFREEYSSGIRYKTSPVDASLILPEWDSVRQKKRQDFLGFGVKELPLNGRVYMPLGEGPFPIFLIVHGNHAMTDWSDGGYRYLGRHLASRGIVVVSVDENFLNGHWTGDFRGREMPARAWILLKHLELWDQWNRDAEHDLSGKIDMDKIILAGHSRGGEAVQIASVFNSLDRFPENGNQDFDFHFSIQGVVSIAPTDYRYDRQVSMENVSYLGIQGSYDSDESSFWGMRAYRRLTLNDSTEQFKAGIYVHRANHSQFNSDWGNSDSGVPFSWFLNRASLISAEDQRKIARFYITGFSEKVFGTSAIPDRLFTHVDDYRSMLPQTFVLTHFSSSKTKPLLTFGEDPDILRAHSSIQLTGQNLLIWRESDLKSRDRQSLENYGLFLGWYTDSSRIISDPPAYKITSDSAFWKDPVSSVSFTFGAGNYQLLKPLLPDSIKLKEPTIDLSVEFMDRSGERVRIQSSEVKKIAPRLITEFGKLEEINSRLGKWEVQTETHHYSREMLIGKNPEFDLNQLRSIRLIFDRVPYGVLVLDAVEFSID